jgi:signal transduction histidine kinase
VRDRLHCDVEGRIESGLPPLRADRDALTTALLNLLDNACKYTPADKRIALRVYRERQHVVFAVEDNGVGIPATEQRRIFRRFYRVDRELASATTGVGLGLSIVREIARAHRGDVDVVSRPGAGSTFSMRVPVAPAAA